MLLAPADLQRRRPVWQALSELFLDTTLDEDRYRHIAGQVTASGYNLREIQCILWEEVFPALRFNVFHPAGEWALFDIDWLQKQILQQAGRRGLILRSLDAIPLYGRAWCIKLEWKKVSRFLPEVFRNPNSTPRI